MNFLIYTKRDDGEVLYKSGCFIYDKNFLILEGEMNGEAVKDMFLLKERWKDKDIEEILDFLF